MPKNSKTYKLKELTTKIGSGATPRGGKEAYKESGISLIRSQNVLDLSFSSNGLAFIDDDQAAALNNVTLESKDILLNITGDSVARVCKVPDHRLPARVNQHVAIVRANEKILNPDFLLYSLLSKENKNLLLTMAGAGATRNALTKTMIEEFEISIPPIQEQKSISSILSALDDKIELNLQMNKTLEEMAMALYKHWFVDFGPFQEGEFVGSELGEIPKGWEVKTVEDLVEHSVGGDWGKPEKDKNHLIEAKVIRGTDLLNTANGDFSKIPIRWIKASKYESRKLINGDIIIEISGGSTDQPTGRSLFLNSRLIENLGNNVIPTSFCRLIRAKNLDLSFVLAIHLKYIYQAGKTWFYQNQSTGISNFQYSFFKNEEKIALPKDQKVLKGFTELVSPLFDKMYLNENQTLIQLRDTLLPKLISGEVRVKDAEKTLSEVL